MRAAGISPRAQADRIAGGDLGNGRDALSREAVREALVDPR
jgi:hypothetical protein